MDAWVSVEVLLTFGPLFFWALEKEGPKGSGKRLKTSKCLVNRDFLKREPDRRLRHIIVPSPMVFPVIMDHNFPKEHSKG